jgi:hypothetical protein
LSALGRSLAAALRVCPMAPVLPSGPSPDAGSVTSSAAVSNLIGLSLERTPSDSEPRRRSVKRRHTLGFEAPAEVRTAQSCPAPPTLLYRTISMWLAHTGPTGPGDAGPSPANPENVVRQSWHQCQFEDRYGRLHIGGRLRVGERSRGNARNIDAEIACFEQRTSRQK